MMYTIPVSPLRFQDDQHIPIQISCRPRRTCRQPRHCGRQAYGAPAWLFTPAGQPHHQRNPFNVAPLIEDVVGIWKAMAGVPEDEPNKPALKPDWKKEVDCGGFSPDEVKLEISDDKVFVTSSHESSDGKGNTEVRQMKRTITVPSDVNREQISATFDNRGVLRLSAPRKTELSEKPEGDVAAKPAETTPEVRKDDAAEAVGLCEGCLEDNQGETTEPPVEQMNIQKPDSSNPEENQDLSEEKLSSDKKDTEESLQPENKPFELKVDMTSFNPDSIKVKLNGNTVTIEGNREEKDETTGKILSNQTVFRRLVMPIDVNTDLLKSTLDKQGQLTISAPYKEGEKVIPLSVD